MGTLPDDNSVQVPLAQAMQDALERKTNALDAARLHLYPYYGEAYAEILLPGADPDFNFVFQWGPRLTPAERTLIHTLVYIARRQAGFAALQTALTGQPCDVRVELYIESVPTRIRGEALQSGVASPLSLAELTNLSASTLYRTLESPTVRQFVQVEKGQRIHRDGRVFTTAARFSVRVDPVPTPQQTETLRRRVAEKMLQDELGLLVTSQNDRSLTVQNERSLMPQIDRSVTLQNERSVTVQSDRSDEREVMPQIDRSEARNDLTCQNERSEPISNRPFILTGQLESLRNPESRNVTVTGPDGPKTETPNGYKSEEKLAEWRKRNEDLARHSAEQLGDEGSLGYHIHAWHYARKADQKRKDEHETLTSGLFKILTELAERRRRTGRNQGAAWTKRTKEWFIQNGMPLHDKIREADLDPEELAEVRAALAYLNDNDQERAAPRPIVPESPPVREDPTSGPSTNPYLAWADRMAERAKNGGGDPQ